VNRTGLVEARTFNRFSFYGAKDALVQTYGTFVQMARAWDYSSGRPLLESTESLSPSATLRGGWQVGGSVGRNGFAYNPADYGNLSIVTHQGAFTDTVSFAVPGFERDQYSGSLRITSPTLKFMSATAGVTTGKTPIFREASQGRSTRIDGALDLRPTTSLRASLQFSRLTLTRSFNDSRFSTETIPRLKLEYQMTRAIFFRLVGQYAARSRSSLIDREGNAILVNGVLDAGTKSNEFTTDWLFSYRPIPGTLAYLGYGSTMTEPKEFRFSNLERTRDGFFGKLSYLFRF
jgi:hypothetical protein